MRSARLVLGLSAAFAVVGGLSAAMNPAMADDKNPAPSAAATAPAPTDNVPSYDLLEAVKKGLVSVSAEGIGDGRMTLSVKNRSKKQLRVVMPTGLIASGASGQFGGMGGGMGGMGGGMGGMGGGMGGMGGGMGGMGGGMGGGGMGGGGMGGGMGGGGMGGGGMGGGGMGGGVMPASMGMMMLGRLIMSLVGDRDSWDQRSLMSGMMGGMGGGMGGGGMGGMGGGGMGGMGGGFRSIPPTGPPTALLKPDQTRHLPTRLASLSAPNPDDPESKVVMPQKGEHLSLGDVRNRTNDERVAKALARLAEDKAPDTVATLVMWNVASGLDWGAIARKSEGFANGHELSLAKHFVAQLADLPKDDTGVLLYEVAGKGEAGVTLAAELSDVLKDKLVLGLKAKAGVPAAPTGPAVACKILIDASKTKPEATVHVSTTDGAAERWVGAGKFELPVTGDAGKLRAAKFADTLAEGLLGRLVRAQVSKAGMVKGKAVYRVRIDNASPLILNGLAILGTGQGKAEATPKLLTGISVSPRKSLSVPATAETVDQLGLRKGVRVIAADLSGL